jgi:hypothetical protein
MRTTAVRTASLFAAGAAVLLLGACGGGDDPVASAADGGAAGTVEEGTPEDGPLPADADVCARYAADGQAFLDAYDAYGSGATADPGDLHASLETLAADVDSAPVGEVSPDVLTAVQETSAAAAEAVPALEGGEGVEEVDATIGGLESLTAACAALGL